MQFVELHVYDWHPQSNPEQETFAAHIGGAFVNACPEPEKHALSLLG
jgi:hypothetical protein